MPRMDKQASFTEKRSSGKVPRIEVSSKAEDMEIDEKDPELILPSYPSLTGNIVMESTAVSPAVNEIDHLTGEKVCFVMKMIHSCSVNVHTILAVKYFYFGFSTGTSPTIRQSQCVWTCYGAKTTREHGKRIPYKGGLQHC